MIYYYLFVMFIFGLCMGSFFLVVGTRLSEEKSIIKPNSHCTHCKKILKSRDLIPVFSYLLNRGKCRYCHTKIGAIYPIVEIMTGILFVITYIFFPAYSLNLMIGLILASLVIIISVSDFKYLIIPDEVLIVSATLIVIFRLIFSGFNSTLPYMLSGILAFVIMLLIKLIGDRVFKQESMGGADIKLLGVVGLALGLLPSLFVIFLGSFFALPIAIIILVKRKEHILPYGPFLAIATWILWLYMPQFGRLVDYLFMI